MVRRGWQSWLAAGALLLGARSALGAPGDADATRYAELLRRGKEAASAKRWEACIVALTDAIGIDKTPAALGELGLCEWQAGRFAPAHAHLWQALEPAPADKSKEPWKRYQDALVQVRDRVALLIITTKPPSARVIVDGHPIGRGDGQTVGVAPGKHTIVGRLEGYKDTIVETDDLRAGATPNYDIKLEPNPPPPAPPAVTSPPSASSLAPPPSKASRLLAPAWSPRGVLVTLAYAGTATTLVSGATAIGFEVHRQSLQTALEAKGYQNDTCRSQQPPYSAAACADIRSRYEQRNTSANVLIGSAITLAALWGAAGLAMYLDRSPLRPTVTATASENGGGIVVLGAW